ncbi:hypothetical protein GCM10023194_21220 [Planotetraspora phitsanulokensis]|uniref:Uncharacterized protein n=1 Tax=Planotetraspora phitsanulokensis TaxID=575192 RepID=A0A8J3XEJ7_9ACTN|nr:hypothetical protein Pph01_31830 [Planotetraspora phitsanulokensis]
MSGMNADVGPMGAEELSFGGDPDRRQWLREWVSVHRKAMVTVSAVFILLSVLIASLSPRPSSLHSAKPSDLGSQSNASQSSTLVAG